MNHWLVPVAQAVQDDPARLIQSLPWFGWVAIVAIVMGGVNGVVSALARHRERMAMIRQGMHPDVAPQVDPDAKPAYREAAEI